MTKKPFVGKLTDKQKYLLQRIPSLYQMNGYECPAEPVEVRHARKLVERWDKTQARLECEAGKRNQALIRKAREVVYFGTPEKALAVIQQCEKRLKGCPV